MAMIRRLPAWTWCVAGLGLALFMTFAIRAGRVVQPGPSSVVLWGDSQSTAGSGYFDELVELLPTRTVFLEGIGGQTATMVAARMGGVPVVFRAPVVLNPAGCADFGPEALNIDLLRTPNIMVSIRVSLAGRPGVLTYLGSPAYHLCLKAGGNRSEVVRAGSQLQIVSGFEEGEDAQNAPSLSALLSGVAVVRAGRNDVNGIAPIEDKLEMVDAMVRQVRAHGGKFLVVGQMLGQHDLPVALGGTAKNPQISIALFDGQTRWNSWLARRYGPAFIDIHARHVQRDGARTVALYDAGQHRSFAVLTADAASPKLVDGVHENKQGQQEAAEMVASFLSVAR